MTSYDEAMSKLRDMVASALLPIKHDKRYEDFTEVLAGDVNSVCVGKVYIKLGTVTKDHDHYTVNVEIKGTAYHTFIAAHGGETTVIKSNLIYTRSGDETGFSQAVIDWMANRLFNMCRMYWQEYADKFDELVEKKATPTS